MRGRVTALNSAAAFGVLIATSAHAQPLAAADRYEVWAQSESHLQLFRRALLPGPNGAVVSRQTVAPLHQYIRVNARNVDIGSNEDSLDVELAAWGRLWLGEREDEPAVDGDVQLANARYVHGPFSLRLGRQVVAGGAARYARFDGAAVEAELGAVASALAYGGFTVLPRWDARHGYAYLGAAADSDLRHPEVLAALDRGSHWLAGGRLGISPVPSAQAGVSFHEQRERGGLARRNLGVDGRAELGPASLAGSAVMELSERELADARVWVDATLSRALDASVEYLHMDPSLFLSRQSVLSVFGADGYHEVGGTLVARASERLTFDAGAWAELYDADEPGARTELSTKAALGPSRRTLVMLTYGRLEAPDNGYHTLRVSGAERFNAQLSGTIEAYYYWYDEAIRGYRSSSVYAATLTYQAAEDLGLLWGASLARSAYASHDAQTQVRLTYAFDFTSRRSEP